MHSTPVAQPQKRCDVVASCAQHKEDASIDIPICWWGLDHFGSVLRFDVTSRGVALPCGVAGVAFSLRCLADWANLFLIVRNIRAEFGISTAWQGDIDQNLLLLRDGRGLTW